MAPSVVGTNEGGAPVIDLGALTGMGAQMQGGDAAMPPTSEMEAARQAAEAAAAEFDRSRSRLSRAWTGASSSESEGGSSEEESEAGNTVDSPDEEVWSLRTSSRRRWTPRWSPARWKAPAPLRVRAYSSRDA